MRTSLDVPDELFRHLKTKAAAEGSTLRDLILSLVEAGLAGNQAPVPMGEPAELPSVSLGAPMALGAADLTNAKLDGYPDE